jgi:hypothetical protein
MVGLLVVLLVASCGPDRAAGIVFTNETGETVRISYVVAGVEQALEGEFERDTIPHVGAATYDFDLFDAGNTTRCTTGDIVARTLDGLEVDRIPPPVCNGDSVRLFAPEDFDAANE